MVNCAMDIIGKPKKSDQGKTEKKEKKHKKHKKDKQDKKNKKKSLKLDAAEKMGKLDKSKVIKKSSAKYAPLCKVVTKAVTPIIPYTPSLQPVNAE